MNGPTPFHRLFGLSWIDFFDGTDFEVVTEIDLSVKEQFLDLVLIRKGPKPLDPRLPDGFDLSVYNLVTFKSYQEPLDDWLKELMGHYVNYRKQSSPSLQELLQETDYRLFAVSARFPQQLAKQATLTRLAEGVYEVLVLTQSIRIIVVAQLPQAEHNAMLHLFSANLELVRYGQEHYLPHSRETSTLLANLFKLYREEPDMADKRLKEFARQTIDEILANLPAEERLKGLPAEELRKRLSPQERLEGLSVEEMVSWLSPEAREALAKQLKAVGSSGQPQ